MIIALARRSSDVLSCEAVGPFPDSASAWAFAHEWDIGRRVADRSGAESFEVFVVAPETARSPGAYIRQRRAEEAQ